MQEVCGTGAFSRAGDDVTLALARHVADWTVGKGSWQWSAGGLGVSGKLGILCANVAAVVDVPRAPFYFSRMGASEKVRARHRAREVQARNNAARYGRDRANEADAVTVRSVLQRIGAVDVWERTRLDQASEQVRADAMKRRARYFSELQSAVSQMRDRGQTFATIAALVGVEVREIQTALRRARTGGVERRGSAGSVAATLDASMESRDPLSDGVDRRPRNERDVGAYDPTRCVRCDAAMLDEDTASRRGRRRLYCSDTCRRDASAARKAAERFGTPIRVLEVPKFVASQEYTAEAGVTEACGPMTPLVASNIALADNEALRGLLARVTEQARLKKLDRLTLTAARELAKAVHPHRTW